MSSSENSRRLEDIARQGAICQRVADKGFEQFIERSEAGRLNRSQAERSLEIIAEASKHLDPEFKAAHLNIPWREITDMRNLINHAYGQVDYHVVWRAISGEIPDLLDDLGIEPDPDPYSHL